MVITYWEGLQVKEIKILDYEIKKNTTKSAEWIIKYAQRKQVRRSHIILDEDGVGGGVVDQIEGCIGFTNNAQAIQSDEAKDDKTKQVNFANLKTQCYFKLAQLSEEGKIGISEVSSEIKELLIEELEQVKQKDIDKDLRIKLIDKDKIKENIGRSPDVSDAIMFRMYFELKEETEYKVISL